MFSGFKSLAYFGIAFFAIVSPIVLIDKHWFQLLTSLNIYTKILHIEKNSFWPNIKPWSFI